LDDCEGEAPAVSQYREGANRSTRSELHSVSDAKEDDKILKLHVQMRAKELGFQQKEENSDKFAGGSDGYESEG
jgi:hypothetical protein